MLDLVKLRKKAKKKGAEEVPAPEPQPQQPEAPSEPSTQQLNNATTQQLNNSTTPSPETNKLQAFLATAGQRREGLITEAETQADGETIELLTFVIAGEHYALPIENIVEIVTPRPVTRIPNADASIVGIISLRGTIVTLLDLRRKLRHAAVAPNADTRIIVIERQEETVGFEVDRVLRVVKTAAGAIEPHPVVHTSELDDAIRGVFRQGNALTILLDFDKLLDSRGHR